LQKTAGNEILPQDKKEEVEMSQGRLYPCPSLQRVPSRGDDVRAAEFRRMMQNGRTVQEFADRLVLLLRNQLRDPEHILRKTQGRNWIYLGSPDRKGGKSSSGMFCYADLTGRGQHQLQMQRAKEMV
jgi:hypothetical protein